MKTYKIFGAKVDSIESLYAQFNDLFMRDADWQLGVTLDGLDDVLYGIEPSGDETDSVVVEWLDHDQSRNALGVNSTIAWIEHKLQHPDQFNIGHWEAELADLRAGAGKTYFDRVLDVFADHDGITLELK